MSSELALAMIQSAGFAVLPGRSRVEITGQDRARLLHGLCSNDIKRLKPGDGCESFLTSGQGKTIGYIYVACREESLLIDSVPGESATIVRSLDRYVIREDVQFHDRTNEQTVVLLAGPQAPEFVRKVFDCEPAPPLQHATSARPDLLAFVQRVPFAGANSFFAAVARSRGGELLAALREAGAEEVGAAEVETARIEAGTPFFGIDITPENLPQEIDRNTQAISFTKGCYLGQETIARLDAMGHVNRTLCGVRFHGTVLPPAGAEIQLDGKVVARITSACWSPRLDSPLALAFVRRGVNSVASQFESPWGLAEVVRLPLA